MSAVNHGLAVLGFFIAVLVVIGVVWRRRIGSCVTFSLLVASSATFTGIMLAYPPAFNPDFYTAKQGIYDSLMFGMAVELGDRTFAQFRGVADKVRAGLATLVIVSTAGVFFLTPNAPYSQVWRYQPSVTTAGIWCLTSVALLIVWYQIPVGDFVRSILLGYVPYLMVSVICIDLIGRLGWAAIHQLNFANAVAYDTMAGYWAYSAWRRD